MSCFLLSQLFSWLYFVLVNLHKSLLFDLHKYFIFPSLRLSRFNTFILLFLISYLFWLNSWQWAGVNLPCLAYSLFLSLSLSPIGEVILVASEESLCRRAFQYILCRLDAKSLYRLQWFERGQWIFMRPIFQRWIWSSEVKVNSPQPLSFFSFFFLLIILEELAPST